MMLSILQSINSALNKPFWLDYSFWFGLINIGLAFINIIVLAVTLRYLVRSTRATEKMQEESLRQRMYLDAKDVHFRIKYTYFPQLSSNSEFPAFGELKTAIDNVTTISFFVFIDKYYKPIGECRLFYKSLNDSSELTADYYINSLEDRKRFIQTLMEQNGFIKAKVVATSGNEFIYTFRSRTDGWKLTFDGKHPNVADTFVLANKIIDPEFFEKIQK